MSYNKQEHLTTDAIKKYEKKDMKYLKAKAREVFHKWIRERDRDGEIFTCISCGQIKAIRGDQYHAGHYHSAGKFNALRFDEDNVHGQCKQCNYFLSGNLLPYRDNLINKIGKSSFDRLMMKAARSKRRVKKWTRFDLIEIIEKYKL